MVVYLRPAENIPLSPFVIPWEQGNVSHATHYEVVRLWELPLERVLEKPHYLLWPLAPLMAGATDETMIQVAERLAAVDAPRQERSDLIGLLVGLAGLRSAQTSILMLMRRHPMLNDLLRESSIAEAFLEEGCEKGLNEGLNEGREEGKRQMAVQLARVALQGRFGTLREDVLAVLDQATEATLYEIVAHVTTDSLEQVRTRLGLGPETAPA